MASGCVGKEKKFAKNFRIYRYLIEKNVELKTLVQIFKNIPAKSIL